MVEEDQIKEEEMSANLVYLEGLDEILVTGETVIEDDVISKIVGAATQEVEGVSSMGKASVSKAISRLMKRKETKAEGVATMHGKREASVDLTINIIYGHNVPLMVIEIRKNVAIRLFDICGLVAKEINVQIVDVEFPQRAVGRLE